VSVRTGNRYIFLHGFVKSELSNITLKEQQALRYAGKIFLALSENELALALQTDVLQELDCDWKNH